jgi:hypothetical protein
VLGSRVRGDGEMEQDYTDQFDIMIELLKELVSEIKELRREIRALPNEIGRG